jgi:hypothetical protein
MRMPGFSAEASLLPGSPSKFRGLRQRSYSADSILQPQSHRDCILNCGQICDGDIVGRCMPWCVCRCLGGNPKKCGVPS